LWRFWFLGHQFFPEKPSKFSKICGDAFAVAECATQSWGEGQQSVKRGELSTNFLKSVTYFLNGQYFV